MITLNTKKILVPIDFSKTSEKAIKHAAFIAAYTKGEIFLLHVQKKSELLSIILPALNIKKPAVIAEFLSNKLEEEASKIRKNYGVKVTAIFSSGNITTEIVNISDENDIDLIIMGTQGIDSNNDLFLGSNAYRTLTKSDRPILTVRTDAPKLGYANILLPIDLSEHSRQKVNASIQFAKTFNSHIHCLALYNESEATDKFKLEVHINQIEKECVKKKVSFSSHIVKADNSVKKTLSYAKKINADLIISMTDQETEFTIRMLGNYIHQLIKTSKIPVLAFKPYVNPDLDGTTTGMPF